MGLFWDAARAQAGREFGARHYRWFVAARVVRFFAPVIVILALAAAAVLGYRWLSPDWPGLGHRVGSWTTAAGGTAGAVGPVLLWILAGVVLVGIVTAVGVWIARNWWRWSMRWSISLPMWMRRY